ncbi:MAG TPA: indole-3-glycerol phosphate synthase TrpC [Bacteroidales bacterium]|nr:indole-3-glycerol phosphate synthase TrpC [Bacteroidales bacterium]
MNFLEQIAEMKKQEIAQMKRLISATDYEKRKRIGREIVSLSDALKNSPTPGIIAEFKRMSPSKGVLNHQAKIADVVKGYEEGGAAGLSILTEKKYFGGSIGDISMVRLSTGLPILQKDFVIDEIQIYEAKYSGADAILLIASLLETNEVYRLARAARKTGLEVVLEIHSEAELDKVNEYVNIIGVNNRNLLTLEVDTNTSFKLAGKIPEGFVKISESGISSPEVLKDLIKAGYDGFLIGEAFMSRPDPVKAFEEFVKMVKE